jgi:Protein of unknown function (DUF3435)
MNHRDAGIFQAYINERVRFDVQAAFLGKPSADAIIRATSHMSRYVDPRAPVALEEPERNDLKSHPTIVKYRQLRDSLSQTLRTTYGTIKNAEGTELYKTYQKAKGQFENAKIRLRRSTFKKSRQQFFDTIDTKEVNEQLSLPLFDRQNWKPEVVLHRLEERRQVADLICRTTVELSDEANLDLRIRTIKALVNFCRLQETSQRKRIPPNRDWGLVNVDQSDEVALPNPQPLPAICLNTQCIFCLGNLNLSPESRFFGFCRPRKAREHVDKQHLQWLGAEEPVHCPLCDKVLEGVMHFKNHAATSHNYFL